MIKDKDSSNMSSEGNEGRSLVLSRLGMEREYCRRTIQFFEPDDEYKDTVQVLSRYICCSICGQLPLEIESCISCDAVIC